MDCPRCAQSMKVTNSRRVPGNRQVVRRKRVCEECGTNFQTEERPRLRIVRHGVPEPFLRGVLLASLRAAASGCEPPVREAELSETVRRVVVAMLAHGTDRPTGEEVRQRTGAVLIERALERVAFRYDPTLDPDAFLVAKRGERPEELFDRDKLKRSIVAASVGFLDAAAIEQALDEVECDLGAGSGTADVRHIRDIVSRTLRRRDERAFLRYALGDSAAANLDEFLERVAPVAQVAKRDGSVVLFEGSKLGKSIRRSFTPDRREAHDRAIAEYVLAEERRIRDKITLDREPETTADIGRRVLEWLFDLNEIAWANYWLVFMSDHELVPGGSPAQQLAQAQTEMRRRRDEARRANGADGSMVNLV